MPGQEPAVRVVLVAPRPVEGDRVLAKTLDAIASFGWTLIGVISPEHYRDALRLVVDGEADAVLAARPEYVPAVMFTGDLPVRDEGPGGSARTRMLPRARRADHLRTHLLR